jgi:hypothetical protein
MISWHMIKNFLENIPFSAFVNKYLVTFKYRGLTQGQVSVRLRGKAAAPVGSGDGFLAPAGHLPEAYQPAAQITSISRVQSRSGKRT